MTRWSHEKLSFLKRNWRTLVISCSHGCWLPVEKPYNKSAPSDAPSARGWHLPFVNVRYWPRLCKNALFSRIAKLFTTLTKVAMYIPAPYGTPWQYCSYSRFNTPLSEITFCFHTAWTQMRHSRLLPRSLGPGGDVSGGLLCACWK